MARRFLPENTERLAPVNAFIGKVGSGTKMSGNPTYEDLGRRRAADQDLPRAASPCLVRPFNHSSIRVTIALDSADHSEYNS